MVSEEGRGKREEGRGKREEGGGKGPEEGRGKKVSKEQRSVVVLAFWCEWPYFLVGVCVCAPLLAC